MMPGSDDEFDDIEDVEDDDDDSPGAAPPQPLHSDTQNTRSGSLPSWSSTLTSVTIPPFSPPVGPTVNSPAPQPPHSDTHSSSSGSLPSWSSTLTPVTIPPFSSPVGPTVNIPESPVDTFDLMLTPALLDDMVEQTNLWR